MSLFKSLVFLLAVGLAAGAVPRSTPDLTIKNGDVKIVQVTEPAAKTSASVTVSNIGDAVAGPFKLRVGASTSNNSGWGDHLIPGLSAGGSVTYTTVLDGTQWKCGFGSADVNGDVSESNENNNYKSSNDLWIIIAPRQQLDEFIGAFNPLPITATLAFNAENPPEWEVQFDPNPVTIPPLATAEVQVSLMAPPSFEGYAEIPLIGEFMGGAPGPMTWTVHAFAPPQVADVVVCERNVGNNPRHEPYYWYDLTPGAFGRCDFHVQVFDPNPANYTQVSKPAATWQFAVHPMGNTWWASWWDPQCQNAVFQTFRFQFTNEHKRTWGNWTTTIGASSNPFIQPVDVALTHDGELDGYGFRVHVPGACTGLEKLATADCEDRHGTNRLKVKLVRGVPGDAYTIVLSDGTTRNGFLNTRGKVVVKFTGLPSMSGTARAMWGCGMSESKTFTCP